MPTIKDTLYNIETYLDLIQGLGAQKDKIKEMEKRDPEKYQRELAGINEDVRKYRDKMELEMREYDRMPERHYQSHATQLRGFYSKEAPYEKCVFVMTKYPAKDDPSDKAVQLGKLIQTICAAINSRGFKATLAAEANLERWLWGNVELYLAACSQGVAIVEDQYAPELNPNVAMEWGWMVGMGKRVAFLREKSFSHKRADWDGLLDYTFDWSKPDDDIEIALTHFLGPKTK
jgi:hypothetical protein